MRLRTFFPLILLLGACRAGGLIHDGPAPATTSEVSRTHMWVDAAGGRSLAEALARPGPLTVHLAAGLYVGPFTLPEGVRLEGAGPATVLHVPGGEGPVLRAGQGATLADLAVRGGAWGLEVTGGARLERVDFSGQGTGAVRVEAGRLEVEGARFDASGSETVGVLLEGASGPEALIRGSAFTGPFRRAVRVVGEGARVTLEDARFSGPVTAVGVQGGDAVVRRAQAEGGRGAAFSVVEGGLVLEDVRVRGYEFGVSAMQARKVEARGFTSLQAERAGLGLAQSRGVLEDVVVRGSGSYGAVQLTASDMEVRRLRVDGVAEYGLVAVRGKLRLRGATLTRVHSADGVTGDGLHLRQVQADVEDVVVRGAAGACVLAAQNARVVLRDAELVDCGQAALAVDTLARLEASGVEVRGGATALAALNDGELRVDALAASGLAAGLVQAGCEGHTRVRLGRVRSEDVRGADAPCVERVPPAR